MLLQDNIIFVHQKSLNTTFKPGFSLHNNYLNFCWAGGEF